MNTFHELVDILVERGDDNAYITIEKMMNIIENETGVLQAWSATAPKWVVKKILNIKR